MILKGCLLFLCALALATAQSCNLGQNTFANGTRVQFATGMSWNEACTNPLKPYCSQSASGTGCQACDPFRTATEYWSICDCPANQFCDPDTASSTYGTCIDNGLGAQTCLGPENCPIKVYSSNIPGGLTIGYWSCVGGKCAACNTSGIYGDATLLCPGGSPYPLSSRQGETRRCMADGSWLGGGAISVTGGSTATTSHSGTTSSSSSVASENLPSWKLFACLAAWQIASALGNKEWRRRRYQ